MDALKTHTYEVTVIYTLNEQDMEDIIVTALEGGIGYWAKLDNTQAEWAEKPAKMPTAEYAWQILRNGGELHFIDEEDDGTEYQFNLTDLLYGIESSIEAGEWHGDIVSLDASLADMIIQYAVFGEVVYG